MNVITAAKTVITEKKYPTTEPSIAAIPSTAHYTVGASRLAV